MRTLYYRLSIVFAASLSLALAGCASAPPKPAQGAVAAGGPPRTAQNTQSGIDTDATIWTLFGINKERRGNPTGPVVGAHVSPILWQAAHDTLGFASVDSEDRTTGRLVTKWYSPPDRPNERFKVSVSILSRGLRSDGVVVRARRQVRSTDGVWTDASIDSKVDDDLVFAILHRAQEIRHILAAHYE